MRGNVERRGPDTWRIRIYLGRHPDTGQQRYHRTTIHGTRNDADQHLARLLVEHGAGHHTSDEHTVDDVVTRWLALAAPDLSPATVKDYSYVLDTHIRPTYGTRPISKLKPHDLEYWYHTLPIGPARIRRIHNVLSSALDQAVRWQWLVTNPCDYARPPKVTEREVRPPTPAEVRALLEHAHEDPDLATYVHVAAHTGARRGELCALRWSDVDLELATVTIARSVVAVDGQVVVKRTKTGRTRVVSLDPETVAVLRAQRTRQREQALALGAAHDDGPVFASDPEATRGWYPDSVSRRFAQLCKRAHVQGVRLHDLRHFAATQMIAAGIDPTTVAGRLGHSATTLLGRYSHFLPAADRAAAAELGRIMASD